MSAREDPPGDDDPILGRSLGETARLNAPEAQADRANRAALAAAARGRRRAHRWIVALTVASVALLLAIGVAFSRAEALIGAS